MSRYIEFTTTPVNSKTTLPEGTPVHNGELPSRFRSLLGVRVDKVLVDFAREDAGEVLLRALVDGQKLRHRDHIFDCVVFSLLMEGVDLVKHSGEKEFRIRKAIDDQANRPGDSSQTLPLALGRPASYSEGFVYHHSLSPLHVINQAAYMHKLGDSGPVCFSGLEAPMSMYGTTVAHNITGMTVLVSGQVVVEWADHTAGEPLTLF